MAGLTITLLRIPTSVSAAADRPASYGKQIISSTQPSRPSDVYDTDWRSKLTAPEMISRRLLLKKRKIRSSHPLGHLGVTYALHLCLVGKPVVDFILVVSEHFSLSPTVETSTVETLWAEISRSRRSSEGGGSLWAQISEGRSIAHQPLLVSE